MNEEEIKKLEDYLKSLPTIKQNMSIPVATNIGINLDDLMNAVKELKKVPTYDELLRENQKLKKQLEENSKINIADHKYASECEDKVITMENQQKEFIEYLVNEIKEHEKYDKKNNCEWQGYKFYQDVLSKYKEIIGE